MSRFSHLEFGKKRASQKHGASGEPVRDSDFFHDRAIRAWLAGDFEQALQNFSRALEKSSAFYPGWFGQVRMLVELSEYQEARVWADKALELFPEHPELLAAKAAAFARDADLSKAQVCCDRAIAKEGVTSYVWLVRAELLLIQKSRTAYNCIRSAISIAGNQLAIVHLEAGRIYCRFENYSSALQYLRLAATDIPKSALVWYELGCCQVMLGFPEAAVSLEQSLKLRPAWPEAAAALQRFNRRGLISRICSLFRRSRER